MKTTAVAHLVRARNGPESLRAFVSSYLRHAAGAPHRLLFVFKGFRGHALGPEYDQLLAGLSHDRLYVHDFGFDIRAYVVATRRTTFERYCFLNSFSVIQGEGWLEKLLAHADPNGCDLVGATGAWTSLYSHNVDDPHFGERFAVPGRTVTLPPMLARLAREKWLRSLRKSFDPFPNYHIRTNAFVASRALVLRAAPLLVLRKRGAFQFESGRCGLSACCKASGGRLLVVGRDGNAYTERDWPASRTYWQGAQENLLVQDNQTLRYQRADLRARATLSRIVWGEAAAATGAP